MFDSCTKRHADYSDDDDDEDTSTMKAKQWQEDYDRYAKESPLWKEELMMEAVYNSGVAEKHPRRVSVHTTFDEMLTQIKRDKLLPQLVQSYPPGSYWHRPSGEVAPRAT